MVGETYRFLRAHPDDAWRPLPPVRAELEALQALALLLRSDLETPWSPQAYMPDSSDWGSWGRTNRSDSGGDEGGGQVLKAPWLVGAPRGLLHEARGGALERRAAGMACVEDLAYASSPPRPCTPSSRTFRVLHLFSGYRRKEDVEWWLRCTAEAATLNIEVRSIDLAVDPAADLTDEAFVDRLIQLCEAGHFHSVVAGPPCTTWSRARFNTSHPGPRPLKTRAEPWGRTDITFTKAEVKKLTLGSTLLMATLKIMETVANMGGFALLEHPQGPGGFPFPSIWAIQEMIGMCSRVFWEDGNFDQCRYGQLARKATKIRMFGSRSRTSEAMQHLQLRCNHRTHSVELSGLDEHGQFRTSAAQTYPSDLCRAIALTMIEAFTEISRSGSGPDPLGALSSPPGLTYPVPAPQRAQPEMKRGARVPVPPMASKWAKLERWGLCYAGPWRVTEHTNINETRTVVGFLCHLARSQRWWHSKVLRSLHRQHGCAWSASQRALFVAALVAALQAGRCRGARLRGQTSAEVRAVGAQHSRWPLPRTTSPGGSRDQGRTSRSPTPRRSTHSISRLTSTRTGMRGLRWRMRGSTMMSVNLWTTRAALTKAPMGEVPMLKRGPLAWDNHASVPLLSLQQGGYTRLLAHAVSDATTPQWLPKFCGFLLHCRRSGPGMALESPQEIDMALAEHFGWLCYIQRANPSHGTLIFFGLLCVMPELGPVAPGSQELQELGKARNQCRGRAHG